MVSSQGVIQTPVWIILYSIAEMEMELWLTMRGRLGCYEERSEEKKGALERGASPCVTYRYRSRIISPKR
jgi:hypothetical protein